MPPKWIDLKEDEEVRFKTHPSMWLLLREFLYIAIATAVVGAIFVSGVLEGIDVGGVSLDMALFVIVPIAALPFVKEFILRQFISYWITDSRLYKKEGIISRDVDPFMLDQIVDVDVEENKFDRVVGKGTVYIANAADSEHDMAWENVPKPHKIHSKIEDAQREWNSNTPAQN